MKEDGFAYLDVDLNRMNEGSFVYADPIQQLVTPADLWNDLHGGLRSDGVESKVDGRRTPARSDVGYRFPSSLQAGTPHGNPPKILPLIAPPVPMPISYEQVRLMQEELEERKEEALKCIQSWDARGTLSAEVWVRYFQYQCRRIGLKSDEALCVFFQRVADTAFVTRGMETDERRGKRATLSI